MNLSGVSYHCREGLCLRSTGTVGRKRPKIDAIGLSFARSFLLTLALRLALVFCVFFAPFFSQSNKRDVVTLYAWPRCLIFHGPPYVTTENCYQKGNFGRDSYEELFRFLYAEVHAIPATVLVTVLVAFSGLPGSATKFWTTKIADRPTK